MEGGEVKKVAIVVEEDDHDSAAALTDCDLEHTPSTATTVFLPDAEHTPLMQHHPHELLNPRSKMDSALIIVFITMAALLLSLLSRYSSPAAVATYHSYRRLKLPSPLEQRRFDLQSKDVTSRITELFPKVDVDPTDGFLTEQELTQWNIRQTHKEFFYHSQRVMHLHDKNRDGFVSFSEYEGNGYGYFGYDDMGWWKQERFNASDADGDGRLNSTEFNDFLHPADSKNPKLLQWLCKEEVREQDTDRDGKVSFKEFFHGLFDLVRNYDEESKNDSEHCEDSLDAPARSLFAQLDKNGDGYLSHLELLPIIGKIHPTEHYYAKKQANDMISKDDVDKDRRLTLTEVIQNPYLFYTIFNNDEDEYGSDDESH